MLRLRSSAEHEDQVSVVFAPSDCPCCNQLLKRCHFIVGSFSCKFYRFIGFQECWHVSCGLIVIHSIKLGRSQRIIKCGFDAVDNHKKQLQNPTDHQAPCYSDHLHSFPCGIRASREWGFWCHRSKPATSSKNAKLECKKDDWMCHRLVHLWSQTSVQHGISHTRKLKQRWGAWPLSKQCTIITDIRSIFFTDFFVLTGGEGQRCHGCGMDEWPLCGKSWI